MWGKGDIGPYLYPLCTCTFPKNGEPHPGLLLGTGRVMGATRWKLPGRREGLWRHAGDWTLYSQAAQTVCGALLL